MISAATIWKSWLNVQLGRISAAFAWQCQKTQLSCHVVTRLCAGAVLSKSDCEDSGALCVELRFPQPCGSLILEQLSRRKKAPCFPD